ncbi:poly [ADP-ribose] polymerase 2 isoform X2 [Ziziphus jujuba]|uniref:Poly [ADP-ribose] polymerase n=1 Tax=Ziziphus jujuba TaxID=326968 RepID=A0ABM3IWZ4_ZIZJJ|nr:poly [ADP-ribose] polymerase 2 isoform X2 [Ziziphus jujuba]
MIVPSTLLGQVCVRRVYKTLPFERRSHSFSPGVRFSSFSQRQIFRNSWFSNAFFFFFSLSLKMASKLKVEELRTQLAQRGLSTTGTKHTLVRRLDSAIRKESKQLSVAANGGDGTVGKKRERESVDDDKPNGSEKIKAVDSFRDMGIQQLREQAALRGISTSGSKKELLERLCEYSDKGSNDIPQESDDGGKYLVYNRWGRVGIKGQDKILGPYQRDGAINEFVQKFYAKTKNTWSSRKAFISHPKSYTWLEMDYGENDKESTVKEKPGSTLGAQPRETKLEPRIAKFISLICNVSMMKQQMMEIGYNADKLPLGKLSKSTISRGYDVLKRIADVIGQSDRRALEQLSGEFYTVIPHDFGFKKMRDFVIDTPQKLKSKLEMVEALSEIEVATKLLEDDIGMQADLLFSHYQRLHCELIPLDADSDEFTMVAKYMQNTHAKTHSNYTVDIVQLFRVSREGEVDRFGKFSSTNNRMLLWHGSRLTNWTGILSRGLRIAPPEAPVTGYMFGKGVYFADMFSKSANYCYASDASSTGVLLLCEVALGDMAELLTAKYDADKLPEGKLSTKGVGETAPDPSEARTMEGGVLVPLGKPKKHNGRKGALLYNEYIVYNVDQIRMRYVVQVHFSFKR